LLERDFQSALIKELKILLPGCFILKNDPNYIQGFPDLLILFETQWAALECKRSAKVRQNPEPNQEYYIDELDKLSFARFIYPENKEEVLRDLQSTFQLDRSTCVSKR